MYSKADLDLKIGIRLTHSFSPEEQTEADLYYSKYFFLAVILLPRDFQIFLETFNSIR